jgi:D-alanine-D-alanine ligase
MVLTHQDLIPPAEITSLPERVSQRFQKEHDVSQALRSLGHDVQFLGVSDDLTPIRQHIEGWRPDVVFNLLMEFQDIAVYQSYIASYLELLRVPQAGCNARGMILARDKALAKKILRYHRIPTPPFRVFRRGQRVGSPALRFPQIVKSVDEEASFGISQSSIVSELDALRQRVAFVHQKIGRDAIAEDYIAGRELTVGVLGNDRLRTFPVWELFFEQLPDGSEPIATSRVKWDPRYQKKVGIRNGAAAELPAGVEGRLSHLAKRVYRALDLSGYARIDFRLDEDGAPFVLEANPNPDLRDDEDLAASAAAAGLAYPQLVQRIVNLGLKYRSAWKELES